MSGAKHMVVLDDNFDFARLVERVAESAGFSVTVAKNASGFRKAVQSLPPSTIVLDIVMPDADGVELVQWLAEQGYRDRVVLVSGFDPLYALQAQRLAEARGLMDIVRLRKPVSIEELRAAFR